MAHFRWTGCILGIWALVAVPALCTSGLLLHPCACPESADHQHEEEDLSGCGHEAECSADPCQLIVTRWDDDGLSPLDTFGTVHLELPSIDNISPDATDDPLIWESPPSPSHASILDKVSTTILLI